MESCQPIKRLREKKKKKKKKKKKNDVDVTSLMGSVTALTKDVVLRVPYVQISLRFEYAKQYQG